MGPRPRWRALAVAAAAVLLGAAPCRGGGAGAAPDLGGSCLEGAVAPDALERLAVDGVSMPLGVWLYEWGSAEVLAHLYALLARDALGYEVAFSGSADTSPPGLLAVAGCEAPTNIADPLCRGSPGQPTHVVLEFWTSVVYNLGWLERHYPDSVPEEVGSVGYASTQGLYVARAQREAAEVNGVHLEYYSYYHSKFQSLRQYFDDHQAIPAAELLPCNASELYQSAVMGLVVKWFPDPETIAAGPNGLQATCPDGFWWLSPGCRAAPARCLPFVTAGDGWYVHIAMQRAIAHSLPLAIATAADGARYRSLPRRYRVLTYWWEPADHFLELAPTQVVFPPHNASEWDQGNFRTADPDVRLTKNVYKGLSTAAPRAYKLAQKISIDKSVLNVLLQDLSDSGGDARGAACRWLRANIPVWKAWLPRATDCPSGYGLVGPAQEHVGARAAAVDCSPCGAGNYSQVLVDQEGVTRICRACAVGFVQPQRGSDACDSCEAGYHQNETGQSLCKRCDKGTFASAKGSSACAACRAGTTTDGTGFRSAADCQCAPGSYLARASGEYILCGEGASCPGFGAEPVATPGYQLAGVGEAGLSMFRCFGAPTRCAGGGVGECADGREGVACALCRPGMTPTSDGSCKPCGRGGAAPFAAVLVAACLALGAVYRRAGMDDRAKQSHGALLLLTNCGQVVMVLQIIGVFSRLSVAWPEPLRSMLSFLRLFTLDIQVLQMDCVGSFTPLARYIFIIALLPAGLVYLVLVHACARLLRSRLCLPAARGAQPSDPLLGSTGTLCMALLIAVVTATMAPLQCQRHPNGTWTMVQYESVVCWEGGVQSTMVGLGMCMMLLPAAFLSASVCVIYALPRRMQQGDVRFLNTFSFLFCRVRPGSRWFVLGFLMRNLLVALTPVIPQTFVQMLLLQVVLGGSLVLLLAYSPWRVPSSNRLDVATHVGMAGFIYLATFFVSNTDLHAVAMLAAVVVAGGLLLLALAAAVSCAKMLVPPRKRYRWFMCHERAAIGAVARLLKMALLETKVGGDVFIDSDNLDDVGHVFNIVAQDVGALVVLCTKELLRRTWCLGEVVTAYVNEVETIALRFNDFVPPDDSFVQAIDSIVEVSVLSEGGLEIAKAQEALERFCKLAYIAVPSTLDRNVVSLLVQKIRTKDFSEDFDVGSNVISQTTGQSSAAIVADSTDREAAAAALILQRLVKPLLDHDPTLVPALYDELMCMGVEVSVPLFGRVTMLLVLCTTGCFRERAFLSDLMCALHDGISTAIPVVVREDFRFPTPAFYAELEQDAAPVAAELGADTPAPLVKYVEAMFRKVALSLTPASSSEDLQRQAAAIARRLVHAAASPPEASSPATAVVATLTPELPRGGATHPREVSTKPRLQAEAVDNALLHLEPDAGILKGYTHRS